LGKFLSQKTKGRFVNQPVQPVAKKPTGSAVADNAISGRQSFLSKPINPLDLTPMGGKKMVPESLRAVGAGLEVAEGVPASVLLDLQRARQTGGQSIKNIPSNIGKVFTGERPAQFGDVLRGANVPEPLAATGGLLASSSKFTPSGAIGELMGKAIGRPISAGIKKIKPGIAKTMSFLSGTPSKSIETVMDNPKALSGKYIKNKGIKVGGAMESDVRPLTNDPNALIKPTTKTANIGKDLDWFTPSGAEKRALAEVTSSERKNLVDWATRIDNGQGQIDFNEADKVIAEIDTALNKFYKNKSLNLPPITQSFERQAQHIRRVVDEARKTQFPKAGKAIEDYAQFANERTANRDFSRWTPRDLGHKVGGAGAVGIGLALKSLPIGATGFALTSPLVQGQIIRGASAIGKNVASAPAATPMLLKNLMQRKKKK